MTSKLESWRTEAHERRSLSTSAEVPATPPTAHAFWEGVSGRGGGGCSLKLCTSVSGFWEGKINRILQTEMTNLTWDYLDCRLVFMNLPAQLLFLVMAWWYSGNHTEGTFIWRLHPGESLEECLSRVYAVKLATARSHSGRFLQQLCSVISPEERMAGN